MLRDKFTVGMDGLPGDGGDGSDFFGGPVEAEEKADKEAALEADIRKALSKHKHNRTLRDQELLAENAWLVKRLRNR